LAVIKEKKNYAKLSIFDQSYFVNYNYYNFKISKTQTKTKMSENSTNNSNILSQRQQNRLE